MIGPSKYKFILPSSILFKSQLVEAAGFIGQCYKVYSGLVYDNAGAAFTFVQTYHSSPKICFRRLAVFFWAKTVIIKEFLHVASRLLISSCMSNFVALSAISHLCLAFLPLLHFNATYYSRISLRNFFIGCMGAAMSAMESASARIGFADLNLDWSSQYR